MNYKKLQRYTYQENLIIKNILDDIRKKHVLYIAK